MAFELIERAAEFGARRALVDATGEWSYGDLLAAAAGVAAALRTLTASRQQRVAYLVPPGRRHVAVQWGIWRAGHVAVPLATSHPTPELERVVADCAPACLLAAAELRDRLEPVAARAGLALLDADTLGTLQAPDAARALAARSPGPVADTASPGERAMIVYTSGTTGRPKGVVTTHAATAAQLRTLHEAWGWQSDDRILHVLPLHHVHGIQVALGCALWSGACCEFMESFDAAGVWERFASGQITVFMAVPTIYGRLIAAWESADSQVRHAWSAGVESLRLMTSGSAALPAAVHARWQQISGQALLERYGMTEVGMALSNPLRGQRRPGTVGQPLPGVGLRIVDDDGHTVAPGTVGEIEVHGPQMFLEYWGRPEETESAFRDGWFRTGDEGLLDDGYHRIVGRRGIDIIKTGGYKVSALEIESELMEHPGIAEAAVVGVPDVDWGERVSAALVAVPGHEAAVADLSGLRDWCKQRLAPYKAPRQVTVLDALPRNAMGKVMKPALREELAHQAAEPDSVAGSPSRDDAT